MRLMYFDYRFINEKRIKHLTELYYIKLVKYFHLYKNPFFSEITEILEDPMFAEYLLKKVYEILQKIKYTSSIGHTINCIITATFNIVCKHAIDYYIEYIDIDDCIRYSTLEFDILNDISWKI